MFGFQVGEVRGGGQLQMCTHELNVTATSPVTLPVLVHGGFKGCEEKKLRLKLKTDSGKCSPSSAVTQKAPVTWVLTFSQPGSTDCSGLLFFGSSTTMQSRF